MLLDRKTDEELMALYQNGNELAFKELYRRHSSKVYGYVTAKIRQQEKANDIFQNVFVKVHRSKHLYNQSLPFLPWLFTITKNAIVDEVRSSKYEQFQSEFEDKIPAAVHRPAFDMKELSPHLKNLSTTQQKAIELRYFDEKTFDEIAVVLQTSSSNVRQLISRGLERIRSLLKDGEKS